MADDFSAEIEFLKSKGIEVEDPNLERWRARLENRLRALITKVGAKSAELVYLEKEIESLSAAKKEILALKEAVRDLAKNNNILLKRLGEAGILTPFTETSGNERYTYCSSCKKRLSRQIPICPACFPDYYVEYNRLRKHLSANERTPSYTPRHAEPDGRPEPTPDNEGRELPRDTSERLPTENVDDDSGHPPIDVLG